jgi:hypothetical protein
VTEDSATVEMILSRSMHCCQKSEMNAEWVQVLEGKRIEQRSRDGAQEP